MKEEVHPWKRDIKKGEKEKREVERKQEEKEKKETRESNVCEKT